MYFAAFDRHQVYFRLALLRGRSRTPSHFVQTGIELEDAKARLTSTVVVAQDT